MPISMWGIYAGMVVENRRIPNVLNVNESLGGNQ
jgi:hypothetical protein